MNPIRPTLYPLLLAGIVAVVFAPPARAAAPVSPADPPREALAADPTAAFHDLLDREWEERLRNSPQLATYVGRHEYDDRLPDLSLEALGARTEAARGYLRELAELDRSRLSPTDRVSYDMLRTELEERVLDFEFGAYEIPILVDDGFHIAFARLPFEVPLATVGDYRGYLSRLRAWPRLVEQEIGHMRRGLARGMTLPRVVLEGYEVTIDSHVVTKPEDSLFFRPFQSFPPGVPEGEREGLVAEGRRAVMEAVVPGYAAFLKFMTEEYLPGARTTLGASELPRGRAYYEYQIRTFTTLPLTPEEIHQTGLAEVARIREEMEAIIAQMGFAGSFEDFLTFLRTDPRFYARTPEELLKEAAWIAKRMDGKLPALFGRLPRLPYGVEPVPEHLAPKYTGGRYVPAAKGSTRAGTYWVNTYNLPSRPLYVLEALSLHEAVPGHHLQMALNRELEGLPPFRQFTYLSAFGEGWGLYSEWLGLEAGFYTDPTSNFGRLTYEMWRACRLVVDTGLHAFGWSREQAMDYLASNTALSLHEVRTETDRYIAWPGQALAYKIGELEIKKLRRRAEAELGEAFDIRGFHDAVLGQGSVPLTVLGEVIDAWIAEQRREARPAEPAPPGPPR